MVLVTEPIILSLVNVLREFDGLPRSAAQPHEGLKMSELERKHGLLQVGCFVLPTLFLTTLFGLPCPARIGLQLCG